jgi:Uma2 family endonuclease
MAAVPNLLGRRDYTRDEVNRMEKAGLLTGRYELIDGELVDKMGQNPPHAQALRLVAIWLATAFGVSRVQWQIPMEVAPSDQRRNDPLPDIAVLKEFKVEYDERHPAGDELVLLVEVSDASSRYDRTKKVSLYAGAGVPEYWVLDVSKRRLFVYRTPINGAYRDQEVHSEGETIAIEGHEAVVAELLPRAKRS